MANPGEGAASYQGGGAGGKFRKKPFRRSQTPYDRPPPSFKNPNSKGWLSKLVDPASNLIITTAQMFFSSVFRKRLPPPPPKISHLRPEEEQGPRNVLQEAISNNHNSACVMSTGQVGNSSKSSEENPDLDLEQLLKQKTFTRSESETLMALLRSRTVELPAGPEDKTENSLSLSASDLKNKDGDRSQGNFSPSITNSRDNQDNVFSPSALAIVPMGKVSSSMYGSNDQGPREKSTLTNNQALVLTSKSPNLLSQLSNTSGGIGVRDNGSSVKKYRGRSAIYNMARSPYFGVHPTAQKGSRFMNDVFNGTPPSSSRRVWENGGSSYSKRTDLKRVSSALEDEVGSSGAIRRVKQKPNLSSLGNFGTENHASSSSLQKPLLPNDASNNNTTKAVEESMDGIRYPPKFSATGKQILQYLETVTPKKKVSHSGLVMGDSEKSDRKLTPNMLSGQALKSLEHVDSAKFTSDPQSSRISEDLKKDTVDGKETPEILMDTRDMLASSSHVDTDAKDVSFKVNGADNNDEVAQPPLKRRAFQMSAFEDFVEMDEDTSSDEPKLAHPVEEESEKSVVIKTVPTEELRVVTSPAVNIPIPSKEINEVKENGGGAVVVSANNQNGFTFSTPAAPPVLSTNDINDHTVSVLAPAPALDSAKDTKEPVFSADKAPSITFLPSPALLEPKPSSPFAFKPEALNRLENISSGTTDTQLKVTTSETDMGKYKNDNEVKQNGGDTNGNADTINSAVSTSPSTTGMFSFNATPKTSNPDTVSQTSTPSIFPSTFPTFQSTNQTSNNIFAQPSTMFSSAATTTTITAATTTTTASISTTAAATTTTAAEPIFKFGQSLAPPTPTTSIAETADSKDKTENKPLFSNLGSSPFTSGSNNPFGISSTTPTVNNPFGTNTGSSFTSSSSGITSFTSGNSLFGTSPSMSNTASVSTSVSFGSNLPQQPDKPPAFPNPFTSTNQSAGFSFGVPSSSATATSTASSMVFGSSAGSKFSFGSSPGPSPASAFPFGSSSSSSTGSMFSFGSSTTAAPTSTTQAGPTFNFGSSTTAAPTSTTQAGSTFNFGSSTTAAPTSTTPAGSMFSFGSSTAAPTSTTPSLVPQAQPTFGVAPVFNASSANNNQMSMEDSMSEDPVQAVPAFGQQSIFPNPTGAVFGSTPAAAPANPFQFGSQNPAVPSFQASGSVEFNAGGSFSLGSGAGDKSTRRTVRINKNRNRKK